MPRSGLRGGRSRWPGPGRSSPATQPEPRPSRAPARPRAAERPALDPLRQRRDASCVRCAFLRHDRHDPEAWPTTFRLSFPRHPTPARALPRSSTNPARRCPPDSAVDHDEQISLGKARRPLIGIRRAGERRRVPATTRIRRASLPGGLSVSDLHTGVLARGPRRPASLRPGRVIPHATSVPRGLNATRTGLARNRIPGFLLIRQLFRQVSAARHPPRGRDAQNLPESDRLKAGPPGCTVLLLIRTPDEPPGH